VGGAFVTIGSALSVLASWSLLAGGCTPYRIEYHQRPEYYKDAADYELQDEWVAPDGTIVKFSSDPLPSEQEALRLKAAGSERLVDSDGDGTPDAAEPIPVWEELEDGTVVMRAYLPQHVIGNFLQAIREERYGEFYQQMLSAEAKRAFEAKGKGADAATRGQVAFTRWAVKYRRSLAETLNRIAFGYFGSDVVLRKVGKDGFRVGLTPMVAEQFKFTTVDVEYEKGQCKLARVW
jgi:hypothetical protein